MARSLAEHLGPSPAVVMRPSEERLRQRPRSGARDRISRGQQHEAVGATWRRGRRSRRRRRRGEEARAPARKRGRRKQRMSSCAPLVTGSHECCNGEAVGAAVNGVEKGRASAGDEEEEEVATARWEAGGRGRQRRGRGKGFDLHNRRKRKKSCCSISSILKENKLLGRSTLY